jgi:hypothetical protein
MAGFLADGHDLVPFSHHLQRLAKTMTQGKSKMSTKKSEAERAPVKAVSLAKHYRAIGPAAIVAALICTTKKKAAVKA